MLYFSEHATRKPRLWFVTASVLTMLIMLLAAAPMVLPSLSFLHPIVIDTDPENMLSSKEPVRGFHQAMKKEFNLYDMVVVGVVNDNNPQGVFTAKTLTDIYDLIKAARNFQWQSDGQMHGVVAADVIAPSTVDNIEQSGLGSIRFEWLMGKPPETDEDARSIYEKAKRLPFLNNTLVSDDGKAIALYFPIYSKNDSYEVAEKLRQIIDRFDTDATYHITGLPIAQDQFGIEMFKQMALSAPLAMFLIFMLMWYFFRNVRLILAPMIVALISVIFTMGLLVITGHTVHIMSSMIPIFIMPIAVLDAVHILSDFFDRYPHHKDRYRTIRMVMEELSKPMFFTSLTTCAGFGSLAFTPIPPVQVFGIFIALGVFFAWILTITLVPAYIMLMSEESLQQFGRKDGKEAESDLLTSLLHKTGQATYHYARTIVVVTLMLGGVAYYGISHIEINDNPVKWFEPGHEIRIADKILNEKFAGTYMAYLTLAVQEKEPPRLTEADIGMLLPDTQRVLASKLGASLDVLEAFALAEQEQAGSDAAWDDWDRALQLIGQKRQEQEYFKQPELLRYVETLQQFLLKTGHVGKSNALPDVVKTVHRELFEGKDEAFRIPDTQPAIAQTLITYQGSHHPQDLWHFVTPDYQRANIWIQLKSGDNKDMQALIKDMERFFNENPAPLAISSDWFGLTYINVIWQQKMVAGMLKAFGGSFLIVLLMMIFLFRSLSWGILSMVPLTVTIALIYGIIGIVGKDYDMPVAVLSSLSLGLAVDYAIHFLARSREIRHKHSSWKSALYEVFSEPSRAIFRNVIVIGVGFLPLLAAPLVPYQTVGMFISAILLFAGAASLLILPALITLLRRWLFQEEGPDEEPTR